MKYPKLNKENDKRFSITDKQVKKIHRLRSIGFSYQRIANILNVSKTSVSIYCDSEKKEKMLKQRREKDVWRWANDPVFKKYTQEIKKKSLEERRKWDEEIIKYNKYISMRRYYKKMAKRSKEMLKYLETSN